SRTRRCDASGRSIGGARQPGPTARARGDRLTAHAQRVGARGVTAMARRLDGAALAATIRAELVPRVAAFTARHGRPPGLSVVLAGNRPESEIYVRNKLKAVVEAGCKAELVRLAETAHADEALATVGRLNADPSVDAILVQSPLPHGMGADAEQRV